VVVVVVVIQDKRKDKAIPVQALRVPVVSYS
jgi:hypothetical protein